MAFHNPKKDLASRLKGQRLVIPDMRPIFTHWPNGQNENYKAVRKALVDQAAVCVFPIRPSAPKPCEVLLSRTDFKGDFSGNP